MVQGIETLRSHFTLKDWLQKNCQICSWIPGIFIFFNAGQTTPRTTDRWTTDISHCIQSWQSTTIDYLLSTSESSFPMLAEDCGESIALNGFAQEIGGS